MAIGFSSFTNHKATSNFFEYTSSSTAKADIQNINNYVATASDPCDGSSNVCGITLSTSRNLGQTPVSTEFSSESASLWSSQQNHSATDGAIAMKN